MVDVYALGNVLYALKSFKKPFEHLPKRRAYKAIMDGERPDLLEL